MAYLFENHFKLRGNHDEDLIQHPEFKEKIDNVVSGSKTIVSVGWRPETGYDLYNYLSEFSKVVVVEAWKSNADSFKHDKVKMIHADIRTLVPKLEEKADLLIWQDGPEHVEESDIDKIFPKMKEIFKHMIFATPNGYRPQGAYLGNVYEHHLFHWSSLDYENRGFEVKEYLPNNAGLMGYIKNY